MAKQGFRIAKEIKDEIINKLKHDGLSLSDVAKQYGISDKTIYNWLGTKAKGTVSLLEHNRLRKENEQLKQLIGDITLKLSAQEKGAPDAKQNGTRRVCNHQSSVSVLCPQTTHQRLAYEAID
jgi:transposase